MTYQTSISFPDGLYHELKAYVDAHPDTKKNTVVVEAVRKYLREAGAHE